MSFIDQKLKEFDESFNTVHSDMVHIVSNSIKRSECEVCQKNKSVNPKGYYKTYLHEQKCYWNDELFQDVKSFLSTSLLELIEVIERMVEETKNPKYACSPEETAEIEGYNKALSDLKSKLEKMKP